MPGCNVCWHGSYAFRGEHRWLKLAIDRLESRMPPTSPAWMIQAWHLYKADILFILGDHPYALQVGRAAIGGDQPTPSQPSLCRPVCPLGFSYFGGNLSTA